MLICVLKQILGFRRRLIVESCDLPTFLDCHIRAFEHFGGNPQEILYDRMKNVFIEKIAGKNKFNDILTGFAIHYGFRPVVAPAYAAWVKGKVERPYCFIREWFLAWLRFYLSGNSQWRPWEMVANQRPAGSRNVSRSGHGAV